MSYQDTSNFRKSSFADGGDRNMSFGVVNSAHQGYNSTPHAHYHPQSASPAPVNHPHSYPQQPPNHYSQPLDHYSGPQTKYPPVQPPTGGFPRPADTYHLPENANLQIPKSVRDQFQQDEQGRVLFFTAPPLETLPPVEPGMALKHSAKYLAAKVGTKSNIAEKRKALGLPEIVNGDNALDKSVQQYVPNKKIKQEPDDETVLEKKIQDTRREAMLLWNQQMTNGADRIYQDLYGEHWEEGKKYEMEKLAKSQQEAKARNLELQASGAKKTEQEKVSLMGSGIFKDDWDPRY